MGLAILIVVFFGYRDIQVEELKTEYAPAPSSFILVDGMDGHFRDEYDATDSIPIVLIHGKG